MQLEPPPKKDATEFDPWILIYPYLPFLPWIALAGLLFVLKAAVGLAFSPTLYSATTQLKLSDSTKPVSAVVMDSGGVASESEVVLQTYVEEARSFNVASRTAQSLDVDAVPALRKMDKELLADLLSNRVSVRNQRSTNLIQIDAVADTPKLASDLANTWARSFIDEDLNIVHSGALALHSFLAQQRAQVLEQMNQSQAQLKAKSGTGGSNMMQEDLQAQVANLEAKYKADHPLVRDHLAALNRAIERRTELLQQAGNASWVQNGQEIKALENTSDWLMQKEQEALVSENMSASNIVVVSPATPPYNPSFPQRRKTLMKALLEGLVLGFLVVWFTLYLRRPVQRENALIKATGAELLGLIPDFNLEEYLVPPAAYPPGRLTRWGIRKAVQPLRALLFDLEKRLRLFHGWAGVSPLPVLAGDARFNGTYFQKTFGEIRNRLLQSPTWRAPICLSIFTPGYQEGRSTANVGLALALAQSGRKVLLVDANPWKPALGQLFGLTPDSDTKDGKIGLKTAYPGLSVLPVNSDPTQALDWVSFERLQQQLKLWKSSYDCVVLDPPPLTALSGAQNLTDVLDGVIIMATSGRTRSGQLQAAMELIKGRKVTVLGCVLNRVDIRYYSQPHRFFHAYSGLGQPVVDQPKTKPAAA